VRIAIKRSDDITSILLALKDGEAVSINHSVFNEFADKEKSFSFVSDDNDMMLKLFSIGGKLGYIYNWDTIHYSKAEFDRVRKAKEDRIYNDTLKKAILEHVISSAESNGFDIQKQKSRVILRKKNLFVTIIVHMDVIYLTAKIKHRNKKFHVAEVPIADPDFKFNVEMVLDYLSKKIDIVEFFYKGIDLLSSNKSHELNFDPGFISMMHSEMKDRDYI